MINKNVTLKLNISVAILLIVYRLMLDIVYVKGIVRFYGYAGFKSAPSFEGALFSWLFYLAFIPFFQKHFNTISFSDTVYVIFFLMAFTPMMLLFEYMEAEFRWLYILYWIVLSVLIDVIPNIRLPIYRYVFSKRLVVVIGLIFSAIVIYIWARYAHFRINLSFLNVYEFRLEARTYNLAPILAYPYAIIKSLAPPLVIWCIYQKDYPSAGLFSLAQLISFFIDGSKSAVFSLAASLLVFFLLRKNLGRIKYLLHAFNTLIFLGVLELIIMGEKLGYILSLIIRRVFFVPPLLNYRYYGFFVNHQLNLYSDVIDIFPSRYPYSIGHVIGFFYSHELSLNANNGLFSDAYANLGVAGMIIHPLLVVILLKMLDSASDELDKSLLIAPIIITPFTLISSSFFTSLLSHGLLFIFLFLLFLPRSRDLHTEGSAQG